MRVLNPFYRDDESNGPTTVWINVWTTHNNEGEARGLAYCRLEWCENDGPAWHERPEECKRHPRLTEAIRELNAQDRRRRGCSREDPKRCRGARTRQATRDRSSAPIHPRPSRPVPRTADAEVQTRPQPKPPAAKQLDFTKLPAPPPRADPAPYIWLPRSNEYPAGAAWPWHNGRDPT